MDYELFGNSPQTASIIRDIVLGGDDSPLAPTESLIPRPRPEGLGVRDIDTQPALDEALANAVGENLRRSTLPESRQRVVDAVIPVATNLQQPVSTDWDRMVDVNTFLSTSQAIPTLPSSRNARPPLQMPLTAIDFTAGAKPVSNTDTESLREAASSFEQQAIQEDTESLRLAASRLEEQTNQEDFVSRFVEFLGRPDMEGDEDHVDSAGSFTYAYGILPSTANKLGIDVEAYSSRRDAAIRVYDKMNNNARDAYPSVFKGLNNNQANGVLALYINLGELPNSVETALSGDDKDFEAAGEGLSLNVLYTQRDENGNPVLDEEGNEIMFASKGLSARRAREYNLLRADDPNFTPVSSVTVTGTKERPVFNWLDSEGNTLITYTSNWELSPDNTMSPVGIN